MAEQGPSPEPVELPVGRAGLRPQVVPVGWTVRDVIWGTLLGAALFVAVAVLAALARARLAGEAVSGLQSTLVAVLELVLLVPAWLLGVRKPGMRWGHLGFRRFDLAVGCLAATGLLFAGLWFNVGWNLLLQRLGWPGQPDLLPLFGSGIGGVLLALLATAIVAPIAEETFFRGFMLPPLRQRLGLWPAVAIDAALFALIHLTPAALPPLFCLGAFMCLLFHYTGSLWPPILLHASYNTLGILVRYVLRGAV